MIEAYAGIDVAFAKRKRLPVCICTKRDGRLIPIPLRELGVTPPQGRGNRGALDVQAVAEFAVESLNYLRAVEQAEAIRIVTVAIDAPSAPKREGLSRRAAEMAMDRRGISCFATPSRSEFERIIACARSHLNSGGVESRFPHANQLWMLVGFSLFETLGVRYECIEVFPQAAMAALGISGPHKTTKAGFKEQFDAVCRMTGWPDSAAEHSLKLDRIAYGSAHDKLDAYLSAWIASLPEEERVACGDIPNDVIWIPPSRTIGASERQIIPPQ